MCSIGAGNQAADVFKSTSHYPSDSDDESDSSALEDVKSPSDTSLSFEAVVETAASAKVCGGQALPVVPGLRRVRFLD